MSLRRFKALALLAIVSCLSGCAVAAPGAPAKLSLPSIIGDGMVLQQGTKVPIWGTARPGQRVTVSLGGQTASDTADRRGRWKVRLGPFEAGGPFELTVSDGETHRIHNALIGEVWVCSGQSNMAWPVIAAANAEEEVRAADYPRIRLFSVARNVADEPLEDVEGQWTECSPETVAGFSAVGYYFGRELRWDLGVPVGLIHSSWGGTPAEAWTTMETLKSDPAYAGILRRWQSAVANFEAAMERHDQRLAEWKEEAEEARTKGTEPPRRPRRPYGPGHPHQPAGLYNAMIAPLTDYAIRGVIWYQGESNAGRAHQYRRLFPAMIRDWRRVWGQQCLPFLFVQLANFMAEQVEPVEYDPWPELREAQLMTLSLPDTAMAVAIDIGEASDIHPRNKQEVGRRLALAALGTVYGRDVTYSGPIFDHMRVEGDRARLFFKHVGSGLTARDGERLEGFAIAGEDRQFVWADAEVEGDTVVVSSEEVSRPIAVRYSWANNPLGNLYNEEGLPASPFRTDDWPGVTRPMTREDWLESYPAPRPVAVARCPTTVRVDGDLSEWSQIAPLPLPLRDGARGPFHLCWREEGLYGAVRAQDDAVEADPATPWAADSVELFIETDYQRSIERTPRTVQYAFSPAPEQGPGPAHVLIAHGPPAHAEGIRCAWDRTETGYALEFFISASLLAPADMTPGEKLGMNLALNNDGEAAEQFYSDKNRNRGWGRPITWGCVELSQ